MAEGYGHESLLRSPTNLKEAIDWILRVTNKDGHYKATTASGCLCPLSQAVVTVLRDVQVKDYLDHQEEKDLVQDILASIETIGGVRTTRKLIEEVAEGLRKFVGWKEEDISIDSPAKKIEMGSDGIGSNGTNGSGNKKYTSSYQSDATLKNLNSNDWTILAKIFLGAIPLVFSGLSYLYWMAFARNGFTGKSKNIDSKGGNNDIPLYYYVERMGYDMSQVRVKSGYQVDLDELIDVFKTCNVFGVKMEDGDKDNYAQYLEKLRTEAKDTSTAGTTTTVASGQQTPKHALLKLDVLCSGYFRALNQPYRVHQRKHRLPRTIREILYWLSCVQYCPVFRVLVQKLRDLCERNGEGPRGEITFYGSNYKGEPTTCTIDSSNCITYFLSAALIAPMVLLSIQDTIESRVGSEKKPKPPADASAASPKPTNEMTYQEKINKLASTTTPVPIHDLYSNSLFEFRFPMSETESYYLLQDCLVALFYQLYFLMKQCYWDRKSGYGWGWCKYGEGVKCDDCKSWICPEAVKKGEEYKKAVKAYNDAKDGEKEEKLKEWQKLIKAENCGNNGGSNPSPLQAFLCDCLKGFTCDTVTSPDGGYKKKLTELREKGKSATLEEYNGAYPEFLSHRGHTAVFGQECAVPMGFSGSFKGAPAPALGAGGSGSAGSAVGGKGGSGVASSSNCVGMGICGVLYNFTIDDISSSSLYQLTRCICSLTRRVPRSTGTLYGFFYGLVDVYSDGGGNGQAVTNSLVNELQCYPGTCNPTNFINSLYNWRGMTHTKEADGKEKPGYHEHGTLDSLNKCGEQCNTEKATCGWYLKPLSGCMYNSVSRVYCDTYLSWILYLTKTLHSGLESLLVEFRNISCEDCHCKESSKCKDNGCTKGTHGVKSDSGKAPNKEGCCCPNVVDCVGVHGLFYRFGFTYNSPGYLTHTDTSTGTNGENNYKRTCNQFYQRLEKVINGTYYTKLQTQLRNFIYTTRALFGVYIGVYWLAVMGYLLWSMTYNLDLVHIQSHWRSPRSYLVPLQRLLADGSRNVKRVCTIGYFQDSGDRLLSQGVSDVYL